MRKLTVDEIIQGLIDAYERLLKLEAEPYDEDASLVEYHQTRGEVKALRWVLGQFPNHPTEIYKEEGAKKMGKTKNQRYVETLVETYKK